MHVETLIKQLGTALPMMGAKDLVTTGSTVLQFRIGRNPKGVNRIHIRYDIGSDTYEVAAMKVRNLNVKSAGECFGVYADQLHAILKSLTGLETRL